MWLHAKTHWDIATEYEFDYRNELDYTGNTANVYFKQASVTPGASVGAVWTECFGQTSNNANERSPAFLSKRFIIPKKYRNVNSATPSESVTFLSQ